MYDKLKPRALDMIEEAESKNEFIATQIVKQLKDEFDKVPSDETIRNRRKELLKQTGDAREAIDDLNEDIQKKSNYIIEDDNIVMQKRTKDVHGEMVTKEFELPINLIGEIVFDYSRHGGNLTGPKILRKYDIKPAVWNLLKSRLNIYKDTNACPDIVLEYIEEKYGKEAMEEKIEATSYRAIQSKYNKKYKQSYEELFKKEAKDAMKTLAKIDNFLEHIQEYLKDYRPIQLPERKKQPENNDNLDVAFSDLHLGKRDSGDIVKRIGEMRDYILDRPESNIDLIFGGDLVEAILEGGMHPGQVEDMDGPYGFDLLVKTADLIVDMIKELHKEGKRVVFHGITGNHDRVTEKRGRNPEQTGGLVVFEMIKRSLEETEVEINYYREELNSFDTKQFHYVVSHKLTKKQQRNIEKILYNNGASADNYNIVMHGHEHNINMAEGQNCTLVGLPSLAGQGRYDKKLDLHSTPGIVLLKKNNGLADILVKRFR